MSKTVKVSQIKVGDVILPPERELRLWMRRHITEKGMSEAALNLQVTRIGETRDKKGPWAIIKTDHAPEWGSNYPFTFKARPETDWVLVAEVAA